MSPNPYPPLHEHFCPLSSNHPPLPSNITSLPAHPTSSTHLYFPLPFCNHQPNTLLPTHAAPMPQRMYPCTSQHRYVTRQSNLCMAALIHISAGKYVHIHSSEYQINLRIYSTRGHASLEEGIESIYSNRAICMNEYFSKYRIPSTSINHSGSNFIHTLPFPSTPSLFSLSNFLPTSPL